MRHWPYLVLSAIIVLTGCNRSEKRFELISASHSNIDFNNQLTESDTLNVLTFEYIYNGSGVATADFNNDGLTDIFFAGSMVSSKLYLNKGDFEFEDITEKAGVTTQAWCTGVSVADVNQDGLMDIYISTVHPHMKKDIPNLLYINKGVKDNVPVFEEVATAAGIADRSYSSQAVFFDYDLDGDLDMYLLTNALETYTRNTPIGQRSDGTGKSVDKLYRNDGIQQGIPHYTDVSAQAGILAEGWGLGIVVNDINQDGYPDVYVANDFLSTDHLYINQRDGTFKNEVSSYFKHQEFNGMGTDIADINNDGLNDIVAVDMMPEDNLRQKTMFSGTGYDRFHRSLQMGYQPQYVRNVLQLNNGNGTFSDIGYYAGIYATDWSWSSLFADFDNDSFNDLLITNGYRKDITDLDFIAYNKEAGMFGTDEIRLKNAMKAVNEIEGVKKPNVVFRNTGKLKFDDVSNAWGLDQPSYSNGAAYADLDNDGDLDIVMNNINDKAFLYRNNTRQAEDGSYHFLRLKLNGKIGNPQGVGARVTLWHHGNIQYREQQLQRGYQSSVEPILHFGLGKDNAVDSLLVIWPSGATQKLKGINADQVLALNEKDAATPQTRQEVVPSSETLFTDVSSSYKIPFTHKENDFVDFKTTAALVHKHSQEGPGIAVGDLNGDGLDDFIIGGSSRYRAYIFYQQRDGSFKKDSLAAKDQEDMGLLLFDADNDNDLDLYCVSGSTEFGDSLLYQHRFYRNNNNKLEWDRAALPVITSSGSVVTAVDFDHDGDEDLFVGGRIWPRKYPHAPRSYILQNDGGTFKDITNAVAPALENVGLVTSALWTDYDNDGWKDLVIVGEWMPVSVFRNNEGKSLEKVFAGTAGWWNSATGGDFDNDGDIDYVCGNLGLNGVFQASEKEPVCVYAKDFDSNGSMDPLLCRYIQGKEYLVHARETLTDQIVSLKRKLTRYETYGKLTFPEVITQQQLQGALIYKVTDFSSVYIENLGDGKFRTTSLPVQAQFSPVYGMSAVDVNQDGNLDLIAVGNSYATETLTGFFDAGVGVCLLGNGKGSFNAASLQQSGFVVDNDAKGLASLRTAQGKTLWIATANRDSLTILEQKNTKGAHWIVPKSGDSWAEVVFADGRRQRKEFYAGNGYLSQSTTAWICPVGASEVYITDHSGKRRLEWTASK